MNGNDATPPSSMIDRVVRVLDTFDGPSRLSLVQVVNRSGLPRSSAHRILEHLVRVRWLAREENSYRLGVRMLELGSLAIHQDSLHSIALPFMRELNASSGHVVHLAVLDGTDIIYLERIGGTAGFDLPSRIGARAPAFCTGAGKALLAYAGDDVMKEVVASGMRARTPYTITDRTRLERELQQVRERGVAFDREEAVAGVGCVAGPVRGPGNAMAAISVCGPAREMDFARLAAPVRQCAVTIWRRVNAMRSGSGTTHEEVAEHWTPDALDAWVTWPRLTDWF